MGKCQWYVVKEVWTGIIQVVRGHRVVNKGGRNLKPQFRLRTSVRTPQKGRSRLEYIFPEFNIDIL
jgi:hypothetical protein